MIGNSPEVSNFKQLFLKLNRFICNILPDHCWKLFTLVFKHTLSVVKITDLQDK